MDLPNRDSYEIRLSTRIDRAFAAVRRAALTGRTPDAGNLEREIQEAIEDQARAVYIVMFLLFLEEDSGRVSPEQFNRLEAMSVSKGAAVGAQRGQSVAASVADDLRGAIASGAGAQEIVARFDAARAQTIGVTETTVLASRGYTDAVDETAAETGQTFEVWWVTAKDDRVCPICGPLHARPRAVWSDAFPNGPPAHPNCRCTLDISRQG